MSNQLVNIENQILSCESNFLEVAQSHKSVAFKKEAEFALQLLKDPKNKFMLSIAQRNPDSLKNAVMNVAAVGLTLNPAVKHAYLVPRDGKVVFDPSYMGLAHLAVCTGSVLWVQAEIVRKKDSFKPMPMGQMPIHNFDPFDDDRGDITGAYCVAKIASGDYMVETMSLKEIEKIRDRASESWKAGKNSPWKSDPEQMNLKTVIKRAHKLWPKSERTERLDLAASLSNQNEGIDFTKESIDVTPVTEEKLTELKSVLEKIEDGEKRLLAHLTVKYKTEHEKLEELTLAEADYSIRFLASFNGAK